MAPLFPSSTREQIAMTSYARLPEGQPLKESDAKDGKPAVRRHICKSSLSMFQWWLPELLASLLSVASLISLIAVLRRYHGRGIHELHLPSSLTLNGLVALLSTLIRASLMVPIGSAISQEVWLWLSKTQTDRGQLQNLEFSDAASRGSWGSLIFLVRARTSWFARSGALITIISLGFGTFTQQLLVLRNFPVAVQVSNILRTESWNGFVGNPAEDALSVPLDIKAATWNGILNSNLLPLITPCPTSNCSWPRTPSLAVCGACSNTTYQQSCNETVCQYKMPSGNKANLTNFRGLYENLYDTISFQVMPSPGAIYRQNDSNLYISNFEVVGGLASSSDYRSVPWPNSSTVASECALWMCVQAFEISIVNATQAQVVVQEFSQVKNATAAIHEDQLYENITIQDIPSTMNPRPDGNYAVGLVAFRAFQNYLGPTFNGSVTLRTESKIASSDVIEAIWSSAGDLDEWIKTLANSLTNAMRADKTDYERNRNATLEAKYDAFYDGQAYQLGYDVRWPWIILPVVLVVWSLIILATTMIKTARSPVRAWKGSPLAILFMDVDDQIKKGALGQLDIYSGLPKSVGGTKVKLEADQEGRWCFKRA